VGLDVYEKESSYFFADSSSQGYFRRHNCSTPVLLQCLYDVGLLFCHTSMYITDPLSDSGHQAFLTVEALKNIADSTVKNLLDLHKTGTCDNIVEK
jgi:D-lactate dehydrogenase